MDRIHILNPDPWPKAKHNKRRLIQPRFADAAARALQDGASLRLATDHEDYARQMEAVMRDNTAFVQTFRAVGDEAPEGVTNWEVRFRKEGRTIHKFEYTRKLR